MSDEDLVCGYCGRDHSFTAPVSVTLIFGPTLAKPYPLIPAEDYRLCQGCDAIFAFVDKAVAAHPATRGNGWTRAILVFSDGKGCDVKPRHRPQPMAVA